MNTPQAVSVRYAAGLLKRGWNNEFELINIARNISVVEDICVGNYYEAYVRSNVETQQIKGIGLTPMEAVIKALTKLGVTFR